MAAGPIRFLEDIACQFIEQSLINSGLDRSTAKALSKSACKNLVKPTGGAIEKIPGKLRRRKKNPKLKKALEESNKKLRNKNGSLKKGKTQADVMKMAHKLLKKM